MDTLIISVLGGFILFVYYMCIFVVLISGDYDRRRSFLIDLIPFMGVIRVGIPAIGWAIFDTVSGILAAWRRLEK
jgi:hypothetical protein